MSEREFELLLAGQALILANVTDDPLVRVVCYVAVFWLAVRNIRRKA